MVHIVVTGYIVDISYFRFKTGVVHIVVAGYILDHYCAMFNRGGFHIVVAVILFNVTDWCLTEEWFILLHLVILLTNTV